MTLDRAKNARRSILIEFGLIEPGLIETARDWPASDPVRSETRDLLVTTGRDVLDGSVSATFPRPYPLGTTLMQGDFSR
jgi:hypothetical protein